MTDTPTPPAMTPEQRAEFVAWLRRVRMRPTVADQLEADGVTIAAAQTDLKAADAQIELLLKNHNGLTAENARLTAALATVFEIASTRHIPDQPAAYAGTELDWATRQYGSLRRDILDAIQKGAAT